MTPKEKAQSIINGIMDYTPVDYPIECNGEEANKIAIADMKVCKNIANVFISEILEIVSEYKLQVIYWNMVKQEIENL